MRHAFFSRNNTGRQVDSQEPLTTENQEKLSALSSAIRNNKESLKKNEEVKFEHIKDVGTFNIGSQGHKTILNSAISDFRLRLGQIKYLDLKIGSLFAFGFTALAFSAVIPAFTILAALPSFSYGGYLLGKRERMYEEYKKALSTLSDVYVWCMNDCSAKITNNNEILDPSKYDKEDVFLVLHPDVQNLILTITPVLRDIEIINWTRNDIVNELKDRRNEEQEESIANETTSKAQININYLLYGADQEGAWALTRGMFTMVRQMLVSSAVNVWEYLNGQTNEEPSFSS